MGRKSVRAGRSLELFGRVIGCKKTEQRGVSFMERTPLLMPAIFGAPRKSFSQFRKKCNFFENYPGLPEPEENFSTHSPTDNCGHSPRFDAHFVRKRGTHYPAVGYQRLSPCLAERGPQVPGRKRSLRPEPERAGPGRETRAASGCGRRGRSKEVVDRRSDSVLLSVRHFRIHRQADAVPGRILCDGKVTRLVSKVCEALLKMAR